MPHLWSEWGAQPHGGDPCWPEPAVDGGEQQAAGGPGPVPARLTVHLGDVSGPYPWLWSFGGRPPGASLLCASGSPQTPPSCNRSASPRALPSSRSHFLPSWPLRVPTRNDVVAQIPVVLIPAHLLPRVPAPMSGLDCAVAACLPLPAGSSLRTGLV